jgi:hypothetical protein
MNPNVKAKLPSGMVTPADVKVMQVDWNKAADRFQESQQFLADTFGR